MSIGVGAQVEGRYRIEVRIGWGGMAEVFVAHDERLERRVALKVLRAADETDRRRFDAEARVLARLDHPNLIGVLDAGVCDDERYLVLELVEGPSLAHLLARGPLGPQRTERLGHELSVALAYVHAQGIVHRDVKPSNVLIDRTGAARLGDFGVARLIDAPEAPEVTGPAMTVGTAAYMPPEQLAGSEVGPAADVYALGLVLLECLTATRAFPGTPEQAALARLTRDPPIPDSVEARWRAVLAAMTARNRRGDHKPRASRGSCRKTNPPPLCALRPRPPRPRSCRQRARAPRDDSSAASRLWWRAPSPLFLPSPICSLAAGVMMPHRAANQPRPPRRERRRCRAPPSRRLPPRPARRLRRRPPPRQVPRPARQSALRPAHRPAHQAPSS